MPAPNLETLYQLEEPIETAVKTLLTSAGITNVYASRSGSEVATPRVGVVFVTTGAMEHYRFVDGEPFCDGWTGTIALEIVTNRKKNAAQHAVLRGKIRKVMQNIAAINTALTYHHVVRLIEAGTTPELSADDNEDSSTMSFSIIVSFKPDAWPTS